MANASSSKINVPVLQDEGEIPELAGAVPKRWGLPPSPLQLLSLTGSNELLVLGTNHSLIIVHHLRSAETEKVQLEGSLKRSGVSALCLFPGMYNRCGMGRQNGLINIYQLAEAEQHRRRSMIKKLHTTTVTQLQWDTRGTLLFSADDSGKVYATEVDMKDGKHHSWLVHDCGCAIVQLSYCSMMLLVSSTASSVICPILRDVTHENPAKVGSKDRKVGEYGGCFSTVTSAGEPSLMIFVSRPGLRVWRADYKGMVKATMKFKDLFESGEVPAIKMIGRRRDAASQGAGPGSTEVQQLGRLSGACRQFLVTWHSDSLWLLQPETGTIRGYVSGLGQILDLCIHKRWVYILRDPPYARQSPIVRLGFDPAIMPLGSSPTLPKVQQAAESPTVKRALDDILGPVTSAQLEKVAASASTTAAVTEQATGKEDAGTSEKEVARSASMPAAAVAADCATAVSSVVEQAAASAPQPESDTPTEPGAVTPAPQSDEAITSAVPAQSASAATPAANDQAVQDNPVASNTNPSPCPSPVLSNRTQVASPSTAAAHAVPSSVANSAGVAITSTHAQATSADGPPTTATDSASARGEDVALASASAPVSGRSSPAPSPDASSSASKPPLKHAADSKVPVIPPQFDIVLDDADTTVVMAAPKSKRKGKRAKKTSSSTALGAVGDSSSNLAVGPPATGVEASDSPLTVLVDGAVSASSSPRPSRPREGDCGRESATSSSSAPSRPSAREPDVPGDSMEPTHVPVTPSPDPVQEAEHSSSITESTSEVADPLSVLTSTTTHSMALQRTGALDQDTDVPGDSVFAAAASATGSTALPRVTVDSETEQPATTRPEHSEDTTTDLADQPSRTSVDAARPQFSPPGFLPVKSGAQVTASVAELAADEDEDKGAVVAENPLSVPATGLEASSDGSSGANSVVNSGEHITSIYDMASSAAGGTEDSEGDAAWKGTSYTPVEAHDVFVPHASKSAMPGPPNAGPVKDEAAKARGRTGPNADISLTDNWVQCPAPCRNPISEITCTPTHIWAIDNKNYVYTWSLSKRRWLNLKGSMRHIAASPSGDIVWGCSKSGSLYHRCGIERKVRVGTDWRKMDMKVRCIAVDNKRSWVLTMEGAVKLRRDVSLAVPTGQMWDTMADSPTDLRYLAAGNGVLWAITNHNVVLARAGISRHKPLGTNWDMVCPGQNFLHVAIGIRETVWLINVDGIACFMNNVSLAQPTGDGHLWQSSLGQFVVHDSSLLETLWTWSLTKKSEPLRSVSASLNSVAVLNAASCVLFSGGSMTGSAYRTVLPTGVAASMMWKSISASSVFSADGHIWMLQRSGEVFCLKNGERPTVVESPGRHQLTQISSSLGSTWAVSSDGTIHERKGISDYCPIGTSWNLVSNGALGAVKARHVSCGLHSDWIVDEKGQAWIRLSQLSQMTSSAVSSWQGVENPNPNSKLVQVVVGPGGWHVWAVDSTGCTYTRLDVGIELPAGSCWQAVGGVNASRLCISNTKVWVCCTNGHIVYRNNVTPRNPTGDYWKRIPGSASDLSVTPDDDLWLIDSDGYTFCRDTFLYQSTSTHAKLASGGSLDTWVVV